MPFEPNNNLGGRKTGSVNKISQETRTIFNKLVSDNINSLQTDIDRLKPLERLKIILELAKFILPTLKAIEVTEETNRSFQPIEIIIKNDPK
jgi:hypothetical protein